MYELSLIGGIVVDLPCNEAFFRRSTAEGLNDRSLVSDGGVISARVDASMEEDA